VYAIETVNCCPASIPAAGVMNSFAGCVTSGSELNFGVASRCVNVAGCPSTVIDEIDRSR
jgi:hypothetical protein